ncbi:MAG TPA: type VII secretion protein EccC, partial [Planosporangium sp.]|nr:type VII secretion protein EccC [Planosporangium sp.]
MSTVVVKRLPRRAAPDMPAGELAVDAPPEIPQATNARWQQVLQMLPMLAGTVATALLFAGRSGGTYSYVVGGVFGISTLGMLATSWSNSGPKKSEMMAARREYLRHLAMLRKRVRETAERQRSGLFYRHPDPDRLWSTVDSHRLWERRSGDGDFGIVRVAVGPQTLATPLIPPVTRPLEDLEPMTAGALRRFLDAYSVVPDLPVAVSVRGFARVYVRGVSADRGGGGRVTPATAEAARALVRAMVSQLAVFHAPDDLLIAVCASPERRDEWEWIKWLPHNLHPSTTDAVGPVRLVATTAAELEHRLDDIIASRPRFTPGGATTPHLVVVLDGGELSGSAHLATDGGVDGVTLLDLDEPPPRLLDRTMIVLDPSGPERRLLTVSADGEGEVGTADALARADAEGLARRLSPMRLAAAARSSDAPMSRDLGLSELLGIADPYTFEVANGWAP